MKKLIITIFAIFYLGVSSGATAHFHYCMGELVNWSISPEKDHKCSNCGMEKANSKNCCKDQHQKLEVKDFTKSSEIAYQFNVSSKELFFSSYKELEKVHAYSIIENNTISISPHRTQATPVFIRNRNFRI